MKTVIVTGSAGLVGSESVRQFAALGYRVVGIDNDSRSWFFGPEASTLPVAAKLKREIGAYSHWDVDIRGETALNTVMRYAIEGLVAVIHTAAQPSHDFASEMAESDFEINAFATLKLLEMVRHRAPHVAFVFCSTNKVYGDTPNRLPLVEGETRFDCPSLPHGIDEGMSIDQTTHSLFGASKLAADVMVQEYGRYFNMPTVCFRGGCLTGPGHAGVQQHGFLSYLVKCAMTGTPYTVIGHRGKQVRDNLHASDLVAAFVEYVNNPTPGAVYNIGGGPERSCSVREAIALVERISGRKMLVQYQDEPRKGDHIWWVSDTRKFERQYPKWRQNYSLESTVREIIDGCVRSAA